MATENQFKLHYRQCNKESDKKDSDNPIECEICKKKCPNLKSYTVHKLFHDTRNLIGTTVKGNNNTTTSSKGPVICEVR
jgi:predicted aldo/keto reductase-like oxidoreductase